MGQCRDSPASVQQTLSFASILDIVLGGGLTLVQNELDLLTPPIEKQIQGIINLGKELQRQLDALAARLAKSKTKQYTHAFISGDRDERKLENSMTQLDRAKADLTALIVTTHDGLNGSMHTGFTAALAIVQRVDQNVKRVLGEKLSMAAYLEERRLDEGRYCAVVR
jgi:hypothetical protein